MNNEIIKKYKEERPWGSFERFTQNEKTTVKIITVKPNEKLSLQYHRERNEFWKILSGNCEVIANGKVVPAKQGDEFFIPAGEEHSLEGKSNGVVFLEISFGHFDEKDEVRLEDNYGREDQ